MCYMHCLHPDTDFAQTLLLPCSTGVYVRLELDMLPLFELLLLFLEQLTLLCKLLLRLRGVYKFDPGKHGHSQQLLTQRVRRSLRCALVVHA